LNNVQLGTKVPSCFVEYAILCIIKRNKFIEEIYITYSANPVKILTKSHCLRQSTQHCIHLRWCICNIEEL